MSVEFPMIILAFNPCAGIPVFTPLITQFPVKGSTTIVGVIPSTPLVPSVPSIPLSPSIPSVPSYPTILPKSVSVHTPPYDTYK